MRTTMMTTLALASFAGLASAQLSEDFSASGLPAGWTSVDLLSTGASAVQGWTTNDLIDDEGESRGNLVDASDFAAAVDSDAVGSANSGAYDIALTSLTFTVPASGVLEFQQVYRQLLTFSTTEQGTVEILNASGGWDVLATYTQNRTDGNPIPIDLSVGAMIGESVSLDLSAYGGLSTQVRWRFTDTNANAWNWFWQVDNVSVVPTPGALAMVGVAGVAGVRRRCA